MGMVGFFRIQTYVKDSFGCKNDILRRDCSVNAFFNFKQPHLSHFCSIIIYFPLHAGDV